MFTNPLQLIYNISIRQCELNIVLFFNIKSIWNSLYKLRLTYIADIWLDTLYVADSNFWQG